MSHPSQQKQLKIYRLQPQVHLSSNNCFSWEDLMEFAHFQLNGAGEPDRKVGRHLLKCQKCSNEYSEIVQDLALTTGRPPRRGQKRVAEGQIPEYTILSTNNSQILLRSETKSIIHSDLIPLDEDYVILELSSIEDSTRLSLEKGPKNSRAVYISLYTSKRLIEKRYLRGNVNWDLEQLPVGEYLLKIENKTILKFNIVK